MAKTIAGVQKYILNPIDLLQSYFFTESKKARSFSSVVFSK